MKCESYEDSIIDYAAGILGIDEARSVEKHIQECADCKSLYEEYYAIKRMSDEESVVRPSVKIYENLSNKFKEAVRSRRFSIFEKIFSYPILVPAITSALILCFWFYYDGVNQRPNSVIIYPNKVIAEKRQTDDKIPYEELNSTIATEVVQHKFIISKQKEEFETQEGFSDGLGRTLEKKKSDSILASRSQDKDKKDKSMPTSAAISSVDSSHSRELAFKSKDRVAEEKPVLRDDVLNGNYKQAAEPATPRFQAEVSDKGLTSQESDQISQMNLALSQQKLGDCKSSIKTGESLLKIIPEPVNEIKGKIFQSLAECYEQEGDWNMAVANYRNLQSVTPDKIDFANGRIFEIQKKIDISNVK